MPLRPPPHPATQKPSPNPDQSISALWRFEQKYHNDVFTWIQTKVKKKSAIDILDMSIDANTFSTLLCEYITDSVVLTAKRSDTYEPMDQKVGVANVDISGETYPDIDHLGKFDLILLKEMLHEVKDNLEPFLACMKTHLKDEDSRMIVITRPKNPPVPLPDPAMYLWRKLVPTREEIVKSSHHAGYMQEMFLCSAPVKIEKENWRDVLMGRFLAALKGNEKCTDRVIKEYIDLKSSKFFEFEEKIWILVLWLNPDGSPPVLSKEMASFCGFAHPEGDAAAGGAAVTPS